MQTPHPRPGPRISDDELPGQGDKDYTFLTSPLITGTSGTTGWRGFENIEIKENTNPAFFNHEFLIDNPWGIARCPARCRFLDTRGAGRCAPGRPWLPDYSSPSKASGIAPGPVTGRRAGFQARGRTTALTSPTASRPRITHHDMSNSHQRWPWAAARWSA